MGLKAGVATPHIARFCIRIAPTMSHHRGTRSGQRPVALATVKPTSHPNRRWQGAHVPPLRHPLLIRHFLPMPQAARCSRRRLAGGGATKATELWRESNEQQFISEIARSSALPSTPTPATGKASVGLNNKWLYEKRRDSPRSSLFTWRGWWLDLALMSMMIDHVALYICLAAAVLWFFEFLKHSVHDRVVSWTK